MIKRSVFVGFILLALVPLIRAACWTQPNSPGATHCQDHLDKTWHPIGAKWFNSRCTRCTCGLDGMHCCDTFPRVTGGCEIKYDYDACTYELIHQNEHVHCGGVGK
ncbi:hypothetical protein KOW79_014212 [Hemibagrus wyckioides]|uniref:Beta-microseminoprotein n=1 Tax=Hemibagrus wyckioides TaxID=337641 RepID=A0A9D3SFZ0_9TELE|nr:hypothetical protein KOW79_014212 [Hemibagrus wyckioides]